MFKNTPPPTQLNALSATPWHGHFMAYGARYESRETFHYQMSQLPFLTQHGPA